MFMDKLQKQIVDRIEGWLLPVEAELLYTLARSVRRRSDIVEIGSWKGKSTVCLGYGVRDSGTHRMILAIDPHEGIVRKKEKKQPATFREFKKNISDAGISDIVHPVRKKSADAARSYKGDLALLFIDGLHEYEHVKDDWRSWQKHLKSGSMVAFHDCFCAEVDVWRAIDEFVLESRLNWIGVAGSILYVRVGTKNENIVLRIIVSMRVFLIRLAVGLYRQSWIPRFIRFFYAHRVTKSILVDTFSWRSVFG